MATVSYPGVFIQSFPTPNSLMPVPTDLPVFIGYTVQATDQGRDLTNTVTLVNSLTEFEQLFSGAPLTTFDLLPPTTPSSLAVAPPLLSLGGRSYALTPQAPELYYLYRSVQLFFLNGGNLCYILSLGPTDGRASTVGAFTAALALLLTTPAPTLVLCPDALRLSAPDYYTVAQAMLAHCAQLGSRVAVLDVYAGAVTDLAVLSSPAPATNPVAAFHAGIGSVGLSYGAAYFPWVEADVVAATGLAARSLTPAALALLGPPPSPGAATGSTAYDTVDSAIAAYLNVLPPAAALAGIYAATDTDTGVWHPPTNVALAGVVAPTVALTGTLELALLANTAPNRATNVLRHLPLYGTQVEGARLIGAEAGVALVSERRTLILLTQSVQQYLPAYVAYYNDASTWTQVSSALTSFLSGLWSQGALQGATAAEAFSVAIGLGSTMTAADQQSGLLRLVLQVALTRPAEFTTLTFEQQLVPHS